eukprot:COSAG01_NODE_15319_length_1350_cov_1.040767_3_plen_152_part_00
MAWSEMNDNQLVSTCGDGSVKLWDLQSPGFPLMSWEEHTQEVYAVDWNLITKDQFATGSWDDTIKLWSPESPTSIGTVRSCLASPIHQAPRSAHGADSLPRRWPSARAYLSASSRSTRTASTRCAGRRTSLQCWLRVRAIELSRCVLRAIE